MSTFLVNNKDRFWSKKVPQRLKPPPPRPFESRPFSSQNTAIRASILLTFLADYQLWLCSQKGPQMHKPPYPERWVCSLKTCLEYQALFWLFWPRTNRDFDVKRWNKGSRTPNPQFSEVDFFPSKRPKNIQHFSTFLVDNQQWFWSQNVSQMTRPPPPPRKLIISQNEPIISRIALFFAR